MWIYSQSTGRLKLKAKTIVQGSDIIYTSVGYSGHKSGKNNPAMQNEKGIGPIPQGLWVIGDAYLSRNTGPYTIVLTPDGHTKTFGRSAFRIHGDSVKFPGTASHGCIILPRRDREKIIESGDKSLMVVP